MVAMVLLSVFFVGGASVVFTQTTGTAGLAGITEDRQPDDQSSIANNGQPATDSGYAECYKKCCFGKGGQFDTKNGACTLNGTTYHFVTDCSASCAVPKGDILTPGVNAVARGLKDLTSTRVNLPPLPSLPSSFSLPALPKGPPLSIPGIGQISFDLPGLFAGVVSFLNSPEAPGILLVIFGGLFVLRVVRKIIGF